MSAQPLVELAGIRVAFGRREALLGLQCADAGRIERRRRRTYSFGKPRPTEAIDELSAILRPAKWKQIPNIGNVQRAIDLAHPLHCALRFLEPPAKRVACGGDAGGEKVIGVVPQCSFRPGRCIVKAACEQMRERSAGLHVVQGRIKGT